MAKHNVLGAIGEELAETYLRKNGYAINERNFRYGKGEIDIIAESGDMIIFVEVKTRSSKTFGSPAEAVTLYKQMLLKRTATYYLVGKNKVERTARFDVIEVFFDTATTHKLNHIKNAF